MFIADLIVTKEGPAVAFEGDDDPCAAAWNAEDGVLSLCLRRTGRVERRTIAPELAPSLTAAESLKIIRVGRSGPDAYWELPVRPGGFQDPG